MCRPGNLIDNRKIIITALIIQVAFLSTLGLVWIGLKIPILQEALGLVCLIFIPGTLLLIALNIKEIGIVERLLYGVGLSTVLLLILGFFINFIYPLLGIQDPISTAPLVSTITIVSFILCFLIYKKSSSNQFFIDLKNLLSYKAFFLLLLPLLSILGAYLANFYNSNILLLFTLSIIALIPGFIAFNKINEELYPLAIFAISISLLYHCSLSTPFIFGRDINQEFYHAHLVLANSHLSFAQGYNLKLNSLLVDCIAAPVFSVLLGESLTWVFKVVYPFLFSLVPLCLWQVFKEQTTKKIAFFSCFFFVSYFFYFTASLQNIKAMMAVFFLSLLLPLIVNKKINKSKRSFLAILFSFGLITSHYGVPYIFLFSALAVFALSLIINKLKVRPLNSFSLTTFNYVLFFLVLTIAWFMYTGKGAGFAVIVNHINWVIQDITEFFSPMEKGGMYYALGGEAMYMIEYQALRILYFISGFFIVIGFVISLYRKIKGKNIGIQDEFFIYAAIFLVYLALAIVIPSTVGSGGGALGTVRLYQLALLFLAPFCPMGVIEISKKIHKVNTKSLANSRAFKFLSIFLLLFLLLNSKWIMEIHREVFPNNNDYTVSISLSQPRIKEGMCTQGELAGLYRSIYHEYDVIGARWLGKYKDKGQKVVQDYSGVLTSYGLTIPLPKIIEATCSLRPYHKSLVKDSYVFLRKVNYIDGVIVGGIGKWWNASEILPDLENKKNKIYSNGGSVVYK